MADLSTITLPNNVTYNLKDSRVPANAVFTDTKVTQTASTTSANYEVLFSATADNTTRTEAARKNSNLLFNPSNGNLQATQFSVNAKAIIAYDATENAITFNFV